VQPTLHVAPPHLTRAQEITPPQLMVVNVAPLVTSAAHARGPAQSIAHAFPAHEMGCLHVSISVQWTSHSAAVQPIGPLHVVAPMHPILHLLPPHEMRRAHESAPMQSTLQELEVVQSMVEAHEFAPTQLTAQGMPAGQTIGSGHVLAAVQVTVQVPAALHVPTPASAHSEGQYSAASSADGASCASPASASEAVASKDGLPSPVGPSTAPSGSLVPPSSVPNVTSGNEHAAARIAALPTTAPSLE
jgi:hypothetical protein